MPLRKNKAFKKVNAVAPVAAAPIATEMEVAEPMEEVDPVEVAHIPQAKKEAISDEEILDMIEGRTAAVGDALQRIRELINYLRSRMEE